MITNKRAKESRYSWWELFTYLRNEKQHVKHSNKFDEK